MFAINIYIYIYIDKFLLNKKKNILMVLLCEKLII